MPCSRPPPSADDRSHRRGGITGPERERRYRWGMSPDVSGPIDPDRVLDRTFTTVRRGADPAEVENYLLQIAAQMRAMGNRIGELERALAEAESARGVAPIDLVDPTELTRIVGEETARVLDAARSAAADIRSRAEESVERIMREAHEESAMLRREAEALVGRRTEEAEAAATEVRNRLEIDLARAEADGIAIIDDAKRRGREMLAEAQDVRQRMLEDLSRRRQGLREQIEQLQSSRDRLLAAFDSVRTNVAVLTDEVKAALPDGRIAAEQAALRAVENEMAETISSMTESGGQVADPVATTSESPSPTPIDEPPISEPPRLTVVPPPVELEPEPPAPPAPEPIRVVRAVEPVQEPPRAPEPAPIVDAVPPQEIEPDPVPVTEDSGATPSTAPPRQPTARTVTEGRTSSSVKVVRSGKAADVFARLREEGEVERPGTRPRRMASVPDAVDEEPAVAAEVAPPVAEVIDDQVWIASRDESIASITSSLTRRIKRALSDEQNELLASVGTIKPKQSAIALLPLPEAQIERFEDLALPALADAATAGASLMPSGATTTHTSVGDLASELASTIVMPLRERIESAMSEAAGDKDDLSRLIRATYREWKGSRVDHEVDFAVRSACNRGMLDRLTRGTKIRWVVAEADEPSPDCEDNALAGAVVCGKPFPTGHIAPPLHPGCHCAVMPVDD